MKLRLIDVPKGCGELEYFLRSAIQNITDTSGEMMNQNRERWIRARAHMISEANKWFGINQSAEDDWFEAAKEYDEFYGVFPRPELTKHEKRFLIEDTHCP
jgi:hypothetical protein